ncbi:MAG: DUF3857 domain-containing protein [Thermoanaerobaculia bacterium]|nr:DUF3857 domain-containing protein [Thermoanaerobaculia bacterium]
MEVELLDAAAIAAFSQVGVPFAEEHQEPEFTRLVVIKPDGRELDLLASAPRDVAPILPPGLPIYSDLRLLRYAVPSLAVGDRLSFEWRLRSRPLAPGKVWAEYTLGAAADIERQLYEVDLPQGSGLTVHVREGLDDPLEEVRTGDRWVRRWRRERAPAVAEAATALADAGDVAGSAVPAPAAADEKTAVHPDFQITAFRSWDEIATWWSELAKVDPDRAVRAKARELTAGIAAPRDQLAALHRYVAQEIRYLAMPLGLGRYQPRAPEEVIRTGLGDCKDKHHLLASLAAVAGVGVDAVLIHGAGRQLDEQTPSPGQFNHVVSRAQIGGEAIWMDATSEMTPMGRLPAGLRGLRGLAVPARAEGTALGELASTPAELPFESRVETSTIGELDAAGPIRAKVRWTFHGDDEAIRLIFKYTGAEAHRALVENYRSEWNDKAKIGAITFGSPSDLLTPFWFEYEVERPTTAMTWREARDFWLPVARTWIEAPPAADKPQIELALDNARRQVRTARLKLPTGAKATPPVPIAIERDFASYRSDYRVEGEVLILERELVRKAETLPPTKFAELKAFRKVIEDDHDQEFAFAASLHLAAAAPESADESAKRGHEMYKAERYEEAAALYRRATELAPGHASAWGDLGKTLYKLGRYEESAGALKRQVEIDPHDDRAYYDLGRVAWRQGDYAAAERHYRKQIDVTPLDGYSYGDLGRLLQNQERHAEAEELLTRAVRLEPDDSYINEGLMLAYLYNGSLDRAREFMIRRSDLPEDLEDQLRAARMLIYHESKAVSLRDLRPWVERFGRNLASALDGIDDPAPSVDLAVAATAVGVYWEMSGRIALEEERIAEATGLLRAALRVTQGSSAASYLAEALRAAGDIEAANLQLAMAKTMDGRGAKLYASDLAARVPDAAARSALESKARDEYTFLRTIFRQVPAAKRSEGRALLLFDASGRLRRAKPIDGDGAKVLAAHLESDPPRLPVPVGNRMKLVLWALTYCSDEGRCSVLLEAPVQAWHEESNKTD